MGKINTHTMSGARSYNVILTKGERALKINSFILIKDERVLKIIHVKFYFLWHSVQKHFWSFGLKFLNDRVVLAYHEFIVAVGVVCKDAAGYVSTKR